MPFDRVAVYRFVRSFICPLIRLFRLRFLCKFALVVFFFISFFSVHFSSAVLSSISFGRSRNGNSFVRLLHICCSRARARMHSHESFFVALLVAFWLHLTIEHCDVARFLAIENFVCVTFALVSIRCRQAVLSIRAINNASKYSSFFLRLPSLSKFKSSRDESSRLVCGKHTTSATAKNEVISVNRKLFRLKRKYEKCEMICEVVALKSNRIIRVMPTRLLRANRNKNSARPGSSRSPIFRLADRRMFDGDDRRLHTRELSNPETEKDFRLHSTNLPRFAW